MNFFMHSEYAVYSFCQVWRCRSVARLPGNSPGFVQLALAVALSLGAAVWASVEVAKTPTRRRQSRRNDVMAIGIPRQRIDSSRRGISAFQIGRAHV